MSLFMVKLRCETKPSTTEYSVYERNGQLRFSLNTEKKIPEDAPVRLTDAQLEELDYRRLYEAFSSKGRNPVVRTELFLLGMGFNLKKLWKKRRAGRLKTHLSVLDSA